MGHRSHEATAAAKKMRTSWISMEMGGNMGIINFTHYSQIQFIR